MSSPVRARTGSHAGHEHFSLIDYLSLLPAPALILKSAKSFSHEAIVYVNPALYKLTRLPPSLLPRSAEAEALFDIEGAPLAAILRVDNPKDMEDWISYAVQTGSSSRSFRTGVVAGHASDSKSPLLEVDWTAVVLHSEFVVLTGHVVPQPSGECRVSDAAVPKFPPVGNLQGGWTGLDRLGLAEPPQSEGSDSDSSRRLVDSLSGGGIMGEMLRNFDWASTPLGPIISWPQSLLTALSLVLGSPSPMSIWWGPQFVLLYNDAYIPVTFGKHPWIYGKPGSEGWSEIWQELLPAAQRTMRGEGTYIENDILFMMRRGFPEESYHTWAYVPIRQEDGSVGGLLNPTYESTPQVLLARRMKTLRDYSALAGQTKTVAELLAVAAEVMTSNHKDISFAMLYTGSFEYGETSLNDPANDKHDQGRQNYVLTLREVVGIPRGHPAAPEEVIVDLASKLESPHVWPYQEACRRRTVMVTSDQTLVGSIEGRCWGTPSREVLTCPILANDADEVRGVLVVGISGRLFLDDDFRSFIDLLTRQTASSMTTVVAFEEEVKRAEALAAIDSTKTAFFSSVSHELRTPLTLIIGPIEELLHDRASNLSAKQTQQLSLVNRNAVRLLKLVNSLLDFTRLEANRMQASFKETDISSFTEDLASMFRSAIEKGGVELIVDCEPERRVFVDRDMWEKIVFNLLGNAFKWTLKGRITVSVKQNSDKSAVVLAVRDTGAGIPANELNKVFERFHRVEGQTGRTHEGSGIGLALTEELVKLHGGTLRVESVLRQGSTFSVTIPYGSAHLAPDMVSSEPSETGSPREADAPRTYAASVVEEARHWLTGSSEGDTSESESLVDSENLSQASDRRVPIITRGCNILLADDNADMRKYVKNILSSWWNVIEAKDGQEALDRILANPPDLVISDVMMPRLSGFDLLKAVRTNPATKLIPIILLSARAGEEARVDGLRMGADDYLVKPFSAKELIARVHSHLDLSRLRVELEQRVKERTIELAESEWRYKALATMSPVGIYRTNRQGRLTFANDKWWEISMHDRGADPTAARFLESVHPDDRERVQDETLQALASPSHAMEVRWCDRDTGVIHYSLSQTIQEVDNDGNMVGIIGTLIDCTERKRLEKEKMEALEIAEKYQRRRAEEAENVRRQHELFIDMTCHELRNPLNAIVHNGDLISDCLKQVHSDIEGIRKQEAELPSEQVRLALSRINIELMQSIEAVETINQCALHQKNIADDVLQVSKISMNLLRLSHVDYQPREEIQNVIRMFETEANVKQISLALNVSPSYDQHQVDWVRGDPKRLTQIMINLLSNAIRFTEEMEIRTVSVTLEASATPLTVPQGIYTDASSTHSGSVHGSDDADGDKRPEGLWVRASQSMSSSNSEGQLFRRTGSAGSTGTAKDTSRKSTLGTPIYIGITISDSGIGMSPDASALIFRRFSSSPKTYGDFGGSGLGLFISKRLIELQGGQIGVESAPRKGTTFKFYVRAETCTVPPETPSQTESEHGSSRGSMHKLSRSRSTHQDSGLPKSVMGHHSITGGSPPLTRITESPLMSKHEPRQRKIMVLIVEDNVVNQKVMKRQLEMAGYDTRIANHGGEALELLNPTTPTIPPLFFDIIISDIQMPFVDGFETATRIRANEATLAALDHTLPGRIPIIAVTGNARKEYKQQAFEVGMDDFMVKPYIKKELVAKIEAFVSARRKASDRNG